MHSKCDTYKGWPMGYTGKTKYLVFLKCVFWEEKCSQDDSEMNVSMRMHRHGNAIHTAVLGPEIGDDGDSIPDRGGSGGSGGSC